MDGEAHAEDTVCDTSWVEYVEGFHLLARADKLDRLTNYSLD